MTTSPEATTAALTDVALFDISDRAQLELRGADRQSFLHSFCTNTIRGLQPGHGCEAFLTNIKGRILAHILVSATADALWLESVPGSAELIAGHLNRYVITEDVEIIDRTAEVGPLCLVGPRSGLWLGDRCQDVSPADVNQLPPWGQLAGAISGIRVMIRSVAFTEQPAFELVVAHTERAALWEALVAEGVVPGDRDLFEALRIEAGFPLYGIDLTEENIAQEAGRNAMAISFTKGCYLGQEPIARLDALGHTNRELRRLSLSGEVIPARGTSVHSASGETVGRILSASRSPRTGQPVALGLIAAACLTPGTQVVVGEAAGSVLEPAGDETR